jgi:hypothetical protein
MWDTAMILVVVIIIIILIVVGLWYFGYIGDDIKVDEITYNHHEGSMFWKIVEKDCDYFWHVTASGSKARLASGQTNVNYVTLGKPLESQTHYTFHVTPKSGDKIGKTTSHNFVM